MKGIILAGGHGTRLYPLTLASSKQLMPIYDKPMIYYPLSVLMMAGIREVLVISTAEDTPRFQTLLQDGSHLGMRFSYMVQKEPRGLAEAFILGEKFLNGEPACLILGDNIFYGHGLSDIVRRCARLKEGGAIFGYWVNNPEAYGVIEFNEQGRPLKIVEKPKNPQSNYAVPGLYFYDHTVCEVAKKLKPSLRGELEITDLNQHYLERGMLTVERIGRGYAWLDTGTHDQLLLAANYVQTMQQRQGLKIACIEEIAFRSGWIDQQQLIRNGEKMSKTEYGQYLIRLAEYDSKTRQRFFFDDPILSDVNG
jgi:glucose-1-phosphate thymidylyltransferase